MAIAFTVYHLSTKDYDQNETIEFDTVILNHGNHFNTSTHMFTCPVEGLYVFSMSLTRSYANGVSMSGAIMHESEEIGRTYAYDADSYDQGSVTAVTHCVSGDVVYGAIVSVAITRLDGGKDSSFSGFLLSAL